MPALYAQFVLYDCLFVKQGSQGSQKRSLEKVSSHDDGMVYTNKSGTYLLFCVTHRAGRYFGTDASACSVG